MTSQKRFFITRNPVETLRFDWGEVAITVLPRACGATGFSAGIVTVKPGIGHARYNHPGAEEIIHVTAGEGEQMVEDENGTPITQRVGPGCSIFVPESRFHSTLNTGTVPMTLSVVYTPAGPDEALRALDGVTIVPA